MNPLAQFQKEITLEKALASQVVSWPLKLYDACPITRRVGRRRPRERGGGKEAHRHADLDKGDRRLLGLGQPQQEGRTTWAWGPRWTRRGRPTPLAKVGPKDVDVATCHDCFTIAELMAYEDLGFCAKGEGAKLVREGQTR